MTNTEILEYLKSDLQILTDRHDTYLTDLIEVAKNDLITETGLSLTPDTSTPDGALVGMYAAWLYRKRRADGDNAKMPRFLEYKINKRRFYESAAGDD